MRYPFPALLALCLLISAPVTVSAACTQTQSFKPWLEGFKDRARRQGVKQRVLDQTLKGVSPNKRVISLDRNQKSFRLSFDQFWRLRVNNALIKKGKRLMKTHQGTLSRIERRYGVPPEIIIAIWGLETGFGSNKGSMSSIRSLVTLAHDCRRSKFFEAELIAALKIIQRGDMRASSMKGAWAGELGHTQFLATSYLKYAVDFDGNGRRDLVNSIPDALGSTGNYLKAYGWRRGAGYQQGQPNYGRIRDWNRATVYIKTIAKFAAALKA